jgi:hypothetical protein
MHLIVCIRRRFLQAIEGALICLPVNGIHSLAFGPVFFIRKLDVNRLRVRRCGGSVLVDNRKDRALVMMFLAI